MEHNKVVEVDDDAEYETNFTIFNALYTDHWFGLYDIVNPAGETKRYQFELRKTETGFVTIPSGIKIVPMDTTMLTVRKKVAATYGNGELVDFDLDSVKKQLQEIDVVTPVGVRKAEQEEQMRSDDAEIVEENDETTMESTSSDENVENDTSDLENDMNMANEINPSRQKAIDLEILKMERQIRALQESVAQLRKLSKRSH